MGPLSRLLALLDAQRGWLPPLLLRLPVAAVFILAGYPKVFTMGPAAFAAFIAEKMQVPLGGSLGYLVPIVEFFGGIGVLLGLGTRFWAAGQAVTMGFAIAFVHGSQGFAMGATVVEGQGAQPTGWAFQAVLLATTLALVVTGPGGLSLDAFGRRWLDRRASAPPAP